MKVNIHFQTNDASLSLSPRLLIVVIVHSPNNIVHELHFSWTSGAKAAGEAVQPPEMRITERTIMLIKLEII